MADDDATGEDEASDQSLRDRRQAEGAAGDLARMGIDPRSLGLGEPEVRPRPETNPDPTPQASVHPLRPEFARQEPPPTESIEPPPPPPTPVAEQMLIRDPLPAPGPRQTSRLLRSVGRGLVTPDAAVMVQSEREVVDAIRQRQTDRRIIAFVAGKGGVGCTTIAVGVGTSLMAMRDDHSVVVDVQQGTPSLGTLFGASSVRSAASLLAEPEVAAPPTASSGLGLVDGSSWDRGLTRADVAGLLDRMRADHTFTLIDVGDEGAEGGHAALARADQAVVVTGPGDVGVAAFRSALDRVVSTNPPAAASAVHVIVHTHEQSFRDARRAGPGSGVVVVPPDPHLQAGGAYDPALVTAATREAVLRVAGLVAQRGVRS